MDKTTTKQRHQTMAATQIDNVSVQEAVKSLILAIDDFRNNN